MSLRISTQWTRRKHWGSPMTRRLFARRQGLVRNGAYGRPPVRSIMALAGRGSWQAPKRKLSS